MHRMGVFHSVIDAPLVVGFGMAAIPVGAVYGMNGKISTDTFTTGTTYIYLLRSKCFCLDEEERVSIERVEKWPNGASLTSKNFVPPGPKPTRRDTP